MASARELMQIHVFSKAEARREQEEVPIQLPDLAASRPAVQVDVYEQREGAEPSDAAPRTGQRVEQGVEQQRQMLQQLQELQSENLLLQQSLGQERRLNDRFRQQILGHACMPCGPCGDRIGDTDGIDVSVVDSIPSLPSNAEASTVAFTTQQVHFL